MTITTAAVSKITDNDAHFLIDGAVHEVPLSLWRGGAHPKMGDVVEIIFDENKKVSRFCPTEPAATENRATAAEESATPKKTFKKPQYMEEEVQILGNPYKVWRRFGVVTDTSAETHTSISTGYRTVATGQVVTDVYSSEYTTSEIRLRHEDGSVKDYSFDEKFKVRNGDEISICYVGEVKQKDAEITGWVLGIQNHTTQYWQSSTYIWNFGAVHHKLRFHRRHAEWNSGKGFLAHVLACTGFGFVFHGFNPVGLVWGLASLLTFIAHLFILGMFATSGGEKEIRKVTQKLLEDF